MEVVVVDSGSTDGTLEVAASRADTVVSMPLDSFTYGRALNTGARVATAEVHVALSSHCALPRPDWISIAVEHLEQGAAAVCGLPSDAEHNTLPGPFVAEHWYVTRHPYWGLSNHASAWSADAWRKHHFDEHLTATEDKEWSWRALEDSGPLVIDPRLLVHGGHRRSGGAASYYRRLVKELMSIQHLRPLPPFSARAALQAWASRAPVGPGLSHARRFGRTRGLEVAARWRATRVGRRSDEPLMRASDRRRSDHDSA